MAPKLSVVIAVYDVEKFVAATLKSFERQDVDQDLVEYVFVDDGSTDNSRALIQEWAQSRNNARVLVQENQGAGAARKAALEVVEGEWVTVVDPDDILGRAYFSEIIDFIERDTNSVADMLVTKVLVLNDSTGRAYDTHPLGYRFKKGTRLVSLNEEPTCIQLGATAVLRTARLREYGLTYDERIEPTFEDAHLLGRYLAKSSDPIIGIVAGAKYYYRKRNDQSSLVQSSWSVDSRYSTVLNLGYLNMLMSIKNDLGFIPVWAQNMVLYDLIWYFKEETKQHSKTAWLSGELRDDFLKLLMLIFDEIDIKTIEEFSVNPVWWSMRQALLGFFKRTYAFGNRIVQWGPDRTDGSNQYCILSFGDASKVDIFVDGVLTEPSDDNYTVHSYFGIPMMLERNIKIGVAGHVNILVDGYSASIERAVTNVPGPQQTSNRNGLAQPVESVNLLDRATGMLATRTPKVRRVTDKISKVAKKANYIGSRLEVERLTLSHSRGRVLVNATTNVLSKISAKSEESKAFEKAANLIDRSKLGNVQKKYAHAWVIMDRPARADDNGEHLYRYILNHRPDINAYFLLECSSPDWARLNEEGFRLVEYGSDESVLLLLNAEMRMSSDAVAEVMYPISRKYYDLSKSKFIFLQHGVTKDDLSRWLNPKRLDGMVCATVGEYESIAGQNSPYTLKRNQTLLTGFPRFDRLHSLKESQTEPADLILVMPTWRQYLRDELNACESDVEKSVVFNDSEFGVNWLELLDNDVIKELCQRFNKKIGFIAHPAFASLIEYLNIPDHVEILDPAVHGFQNILVRSEVFITDYSSVAFDAANIHIPVVYFQFDPEKMFGGGHNFRKGYFDYEKDGFGPVCASVNEVVCGLEGMLEDADGMVRRQYQLRVHEAFPHTDSKNCERLVEALIDL